MNETIAAIASAVGGGIGVIRISGREARSIAQRLSGRDALPARRAVNAVFRSESGAVLDRGIVLAFDAPASFTGEDVCEIQAHGNPFVLETLLARICALGARRARPGEFSERAFLNGKLDLAQAEAIADLIAAGSATQARAAHRSLEGAFSHQVHALLVALTRIRVHIEAAIDFTDEDIDHLADPALVEGLDALRCELDELLAAARRGRQLRDGLNVVITGAPNTGKSSLLNALARSERAIVTATPGTTRDVLREVVTLGGARIELIDTAGLRDTDDPIEAEGVRRAHHERAHADLILEVVDARNDNPPTPLRKREPGATEQSPASSNAQSPSPTGRGVGVRVRQRTNSSTHQDDHSRQITITIHNKIDLTNVVPRVEQSPETTHIWLSAHDGRGVDQLEALLAQAAGAGAEADGAFSARARHVEALERAAQHLTTAQAQLVEAQAGEIAAEELRQAQNALGEITGAFTPDDLLGAIFSTFCIGK